MPDQTAAAVVQPLPLPAKSSDFIKSVQFSNLNEVVHTAFDELYDLDEEFRRFILTEDDKTSKTGREQFDRALAATKMQAYLTERANGVEPVYTKKTDGGELRRTALLRDIDHSITVAMERRKSEMPDGTIVSLSRRKRVALRVSLETRQLRPDVTVEAVEGDDADEA